MMHLVSLRFLTRVTERVLECVLLIALPDHKSSPQVFRPQSLVLCVSSCDQLFVFLSFTVGTEKVSVLSEFTSSDGDPNCFQSDLTNRKPWFRSFFDSNKTENKYTTLAKKFQTPLEKS
jgi:hypothetical protein